MSTRKSGASSVSVNATDNVLRVRGDLTMSTAASAVRDAGDAFARDNGELTVDLAGVEACDSAALAVLLEWRREARRRGRSLVWRNVPERLKQLATISELAPVLQFD